MKFIQGEDPKKTKISMDNEKRILNLVASFFHRPILVFLRGIAFILIFITTSLITYVCYF